MFFISNEVEQTLGKGFVTCFTLATKLKLYSCNIENCSILPTLTIGMICRQADGMTLVSLFTSKQAPRTTIIRLIIECNMRLTKSLIISKMKQAMKSMIFR